MSLIWWDGEQWMILDGRSAIPLMDEPRISAEKDAFFAVRELHSEDKLCQTK